MKLEGMNGYKQQDKWRKKGTSGSKKKVTRKGEEFKNILQRKLTQGK